MDKKDSFFEEMDMNFSNKFSDDFSQMGMEGISQMQKEMSESIKKTISDGMQLSEHIVEQLKKGVQCYVLTSLTDPHTPQTVIDCINYITWDHATRWAAEYKNGLFYHYRNGDRNQGHTDDYMDYIGDDQGKWRVRIVNNEFNCTLNGNNSHLQKTSEMHFIGWDRKKYKIELLQLPKGIKLK